MTRIWTARLLIGLVAALNVQAALSFILDPAAYAPGFELSGIPGTAAVRGVGILFLMWNVPYVAALIDPNRYRVALICALTMQAVGLAGETFIWLGLPVEHFTLRASVLRFMVFDGVGFILMLIALRIVIREEPT